MRETLRRKGTRQQIRISQSTVQFPFLKERVL
jgi:hypothetical protein